MLPKQYPRVLEDIVHRGLAGKSDIHLLTDLGGRIIDAHYGESLVLMFAEVFDALHKRNNSETGYIHFLFNTSMLTWHNLDEQRKQAISAYSSRYGLHSATLPIMAGIYLVGKGLN